VQYSGKLQTHRTGTDHQKSIRYAGFDLQCAAGINNAWMGVIETVQRHRFGTGSNDELVCCELFITDVDGVGVDELRPTAVQSNAAPAQQRANATAEFVDDAVAPAGQARQIDIRRAEVEAIVGSPARMLG